MAPAGVPAARRGPAPARRPRPRRRTAGGGRAPRRPGRSQRPGALPRPARADRGPTTTTGSGGAARLPRPRPARAGGRRGLPELGAGLRGVGARAGPPRPRRGGPGRPPAGPRAARAARGPAGLVRRRDARRARPHHAAPRRRGRLARCSPRPRGCCASCPTRPWPRPGSRRACDQADASLSRRPSTRLLTTAELRVLRLLPTHLSFREMGVDLHVTANTVKTHAHSVYRKLDASLAIGGRRTRARHRPARRSRPDGVTVPRRASCGAHPPGAAGGRGAPRRADLLRRARAGRAVRGLRGAGVAARLRRARVAAGRRHALLVGAVRLLALTNTIVIPVVTATIVAAVLRPVVRRLARHMPRAAATVLVFLSLLAVGVARRGARARRHRQPGERAAGHAPAGRRQAPGLAPGRGGERRQGAAARRTTRARPSAARSTRCWTGSARASSALASLAVFLSFTALSLFFLLKDGPQIRAWTSATWASRRRSRASITGRTLGALRGYFAGVTAVAAFNAIVIGLGALVLGVPRSARSCS